MSDPQLTSNVSALQGQMTGLEDLMQKKSVKLGKAISIARPNFPDYKTDTLKVATSMSYDLASDPSRFKNPTWILKSVSYDLTPDPTISWPQCIVTSVGIEPDLVDGNCPTITTVMSSDLAPDSSISLNSTRIVNSVSGDITLDPTIS